MEKLNPKLINFFTANYKPGIIGIIGTTDPIGLAIREGQRLLTKDKKPSLWSHCFILGDLRLDRRGPGNTKSTSPYIFESDFEINLFKPHLRNGAQENWIGKWCKETTENAAVIDLDLSQDEKDDILSTALQLSDDQVLYSIRELFATWVAIINMKQWLPNPLEDPHAMYCSAYVRYCYRQAGKDFIGKEVNLSNTTLEDIAQPAINLGKLKLYKP